MRVLAPLGLVTLVVGELSVGASTAELTRGAACTTADGALATRMDPDGPQFGSPARFSTRVGALAG